jgi:SAM-dependent methyltransferase
VADEIFEHPRLIAIYDALDPHRSDLDVYAAIAEGLGARRVLDLGCGTGTFALLLINRGLEVIGVDPAGGSLDVARANRAPIECTGSTATRAPCPRCRSTLSR